MRYDVAIIGAGAAGLAAARALHNAGLKIIVLEARDRIGGRVYTHRERGVPAPIELGAEFIHGDAPETEALLAQAGLAAMDIDGPRFESRKGRLHRVDDFWKRLQRVMRHLEATPQKDQSVQQFLDRKPGGRREARNRRLTLQFVEGFQAADARLISASAAAGDGDPSTDESAQRMGRVVDGYDRVIEQLAAAIAGRVVKSALVTRVNWTRGSVEIESRTRSGRARPIIRARRVVVTVPLGVLKAPPGELGAIEFVPALEEKIQPLEKMTMGSVARIVIQFEKRFWTDPNFARRAKMDSLEQLTLIQFDDDDFPVWWTQYPLRTPIVTGWRGGPAAKALDRLPAEALLERALASLARAFGMSRKRLQAMLVNAWTHHWDDDPLARGAYSYPLVGGATAPKALASPVRGTIYFAGEATASDGRFGTVDGAIASGERAARQVLRALR
jgi:monoamine oxidase